MTDRTARAARNQENSLAAFLAKKAEFDALLAELKFAPPQGPRFYFRGDGFDAEMMVDVSVSVSEDVESIASLVIRCGLSRFVGFDDVDRREPPSL